jgi:hypothetical protein
LRHSIADRELRDLVHIDFAFPRRVSIGADEALHFLSLAQLDFSLAKSSTGAAVVPLHQLDQGRKHSAFETRRVTRREPARDEVKEEMHPGEGPRERGTSVPRLGIKQRSPRFRLTYPKLLPYGSGGIAPPANQHFTKYHFSLSRLIYRFTLCRETVTHGGA